MDNSGAASYVYAKASGMLSKAYVGKNSVELFNAKSLSELWTLVFDSPVPQIPESMLATKLEKDAVVKFVQEYIRLLETYSKPDPFLIELIQTYEIENLKTLSGALSLGEDKIPHLVRLGKYALLNYSAFPDLEQITKDSPFSWYNHIPEVDERVNLDFRLDLQQIQHLWKAVNRIKDNSKDVIRKDFIREYSIQNMLWALRLKIYYNFKDEDIVDHLFYVSSEPSKNDPICAFAWEIFGKEKDAFEDWRKWRFADCLNQHVEGEIWTVNPMEVEQNLRWREVSGALRLFHQNPMTDVTLTMFFKLKRQELNCIRSATEAIRMNVDAEQAMFMAGIKQDRKEN